MSRLLVILVLWVIVAGPTAAEPVPTEPVPTDPGPVTIGVLIGGNAQGTLEHWAPTADYLSRRIPDHHFAIVPLDAKAMRQKVAAGELDFVVTDPGQYVQLATASGVESLATMTHAWQGKLYAQTSAAIITRADREDILRLSQLKGKSLMAVNPDAFEGYTLIYWELKAHDIEPPRDLRLVFSGLLPEQIVRAVRDGKVDAAVVPAGVLEQMTMDGKIGPADLRILHPHAGPGFPFFATTEAHPQWPFAKTPRATDALARQVASVLQAMPVDHPAARAGGYAGWISPLDYGSVRELLDGVHHICTHEDSAADVIADVARRYWRWLIAGVALLLVFAGFTAYVVRMNHRLKISKRFLENEIAERKRAEQALRQSGHALRALHDITSRHNQPFADKVRALLALGREQFGMAIGLLARLEDGHYETVAIDTADDALNKSAIPRLEDVLHCDNPTVHAPLICEHVITLSHYPTPEAWTQGSCLCIRVEVEGTVYGMLNFVSLEPRAIPHTETDQEILKLMGQWLAVEIERQRIEAGARQRQAELAHAGRVSAMGEMTTMLAHEINQPLAAIVNYAQGSIRWLSTGEMSRDELLLAFERIAAQGHRSAEIIRRLRDFLRKSQPLRAPVDINHAVREAVELAGLEARRKHVTLRFEPGAGLPHVFADVIQIEQVVLILIHNAIEAMDPAECTRREVCVRTARAPDNGVAVSVHDTGPGLPAKDIERIFEAFYSTKPAGMGMGLSISRSIVEAHGGRLEALPSPDGAVFRFILPPIDSPGDTPTDSGAPP